MKTADVYMTDLTERVIKFKMMQLPSQPQIMHVGTSKLVNDLLAELVRVNKLDTEKGTPAYPHEFKDQLQAVHFHGEDGVLGAPEGWDEEKDGVCFGLPIARVDGACISAWKLNSEQLTRLQDGALLYLQVVSGYTQPPVMISVEGDAEAVAETKEG